MRVRDFKEGYALITARIASADATGLATDGRGISLPDSLPMRNSVSAFPK